MSKMKSIKQDKAVTANTDVIKQHSFKFLDADYTGLDLANEAVKLQTKDDNLKDSQDVFGQKFILFAGTCSSSAEFLALAGSIEARKSWKSKQNPEGSKTAPTVWKQYKSNVKTAWDSFGIKPTDVKTVSELNKKLNEARKEKKEKEAKETGEATTEAVAEAINTDSKLGAAIGSITQCFDSLDAELQGELLSELHTLVTYFEDQRDAEQVIEQGEQDEATAEIALLEEHLDNEELQQQATA